MIPIYLITMFPFLAALLVVLLRRLISERYIGWYILIVPLSLFLALCRYLPKASGGEVHTESLPWIPSFDIHFVVNTDSLSLLFGLLITGIGSLVVLYSIYYMKNQKSLALFYTYLLLFMGAMLGIAFSDNMLFLYVFWELTSIASFFLIAFWYERKSSRYGAQKSLLITVFGGIAMLASFLLLHQITGTFSIRETMMQLDEIRSDVLFIPAMILLLLGAFTKSAQFPFHIWLPDAMEAPTPVSSYLHSATMVKAGIYLVARFAVIFGGNDLWFWLVGGTGLLTMLWGAFIALRQNDLKALLAYSTISQLGLIMCLLGVGSVAFAGNGVVHTEIYAAALFAALFHLINHSTFKGSLFMVAGIIDLSAGTRDIRRLGGLFALMPVTFLFAAIGSFSMAGLPPFNGFLSKEMFFSHALDAAKLGQWQMIFPILAVVASMMTFAYSMIMVFKVFFGKYRREQLDRTPVEAPLGMLLPPLILSLSMLAIFIWPNRLAEYIIMPALKNIMPGYDLATIEILHWHGWNTPLLMTFMTIGGGLVIFLLLKYWKKLYNLLPDVLSVDVLYRKSLSGIENIGSGLTNLYMTERLQHYVFYIYGMFIIFIGGMLFFEEGFLIDFSQDAPLEIYELLLAVVMASAGFSILIARTRLAAIILNGVVGYSIALFFVLFRAPDLALTQLVVETVTTVLFLGSFYFLPELPSRKGKLKSKWFRALVAVSVAIVFVMTALAVKSFRQFESISSFFEETEQPAGGSNIVNAILGDFRAFDTMLETIVLLTAGLGVYAIVKTTSKRRTRDEDQ